MFSSDSLREKISTVAFVVVIGRFGRQQAMSETISLVPYAGKIRAFRLPRYAYRPVETCTRETVFKKDRSVFKTPRHVFDRFAECRKTRTRVELDRDDESTTNKILFSIHATAQYTRTQTTSKSNNTRV